MIRLFNLLFLFFFLSDSIELSAQHYHFALGEQHFSKGELAESIIAFEVAKDSFILIENDTAVAQCFNYLAEANLHQGNHELSILQINE